MKPKNKKTIIIYFFFLTCISILLSGCIELVELGGIEEIGMEGLSASEVGALGAEEEILAEEGLALREATGEVVVADEYTFYRELSRVKVEPGGTRLSIMRNGKQLDIGEIESENSIRLRNINRPIELPGKIYRTSANVNVRTGYDLNYKVFKTISKDRLVLVLDEQNGWCKVEIGKGEVGWMYAAYLITASNHHNNHIINQNEVSNTYNSDSPSSNSNDKINHTKNNSNTKSDSVRLFYRYKSTNQQYVSISSNSPMINRAYFNNSWHTYFYHSAPVRVIQQPYKQLPIVQSQSYSSTNLNANVQSQHFNTQQPLNNQSAYNSTNNNSRIKVVSQPIVQRRNLRRQNYPSSYIYKSGNPRQMNSPKQRNNQPMNSPRNNFSSCSNSSQQYYKQGYRGGRTNSLHRNVHTIRK